MFIPSGLAGTFDSKHTVLDAARQLGVDLDSVCGGRGVCGKCQVVPSFGNFPKWAITSTVSSLSEVNSTEELYSGRRPLEPDGRLGCQAFIQGNLVVEVPPGSQLHGPMVRKEVNLRTIDLDPVSTVSVVEIDISEISDPLERKDLLSAALLEQWKMETSSVSDYALKQLGDLERSETILSVALRQNGKNSIVVAVWAGFETESYGIAIDLGSTTIAGHLLELSTGEIRASHGLMNPQIRLGEDLMSRVSYAMMNPDGGRALTDLVRGAINDLVGELAIIAQIPLNKIVELILVGNPVMHHLFLGLDATPLGQAPFTLQIAESVLVEATSLEL
ncbi:MAG TPA: drug:proton antiporter, partial [Acidimicrobiaceae bacterium]|nr:drug:proton antiporter [Acidimicrobiaceae bacterium]